MQWLEIQGLSRLLIFPPAVADVPNDGEGGKRKIKDAGIHTLGRLLTQLLCSFRTDGALGKRRLAYGKHG